MDILDCVEAAGLYPKRKASTHGGEYSSPCPFCNDGEDRFLIWPRRSNKNGEYQGGRFSCRVCAKYGDAITFLRELYGISYREACERLSIIPKGEGVGRIRRPSSFLSPPLLLAKDPPALWQEKATAYAVWCNAQLMHNTDALKIVMARGFTIESIERHKIGFCPKDLWRSREDWGLEPLHKNDGSAKKLWLPRGITIPTFTGDCRTIKAKIRREDWKDGDKLPKYVEVSGSKTCLSVYGDTSLPVAFVIESELDALLIQQCASDLVYCVALGGSTKPVDHDTDMLLRKTKRLLFCPDFDQAGAVSWLKWEKAYSHVERILTPDGKGAGDAFLCGVDLRVWIESFLRLGC